MTMPSSLFCPTQQHGPISGRFNQLAMVAGALVLSACSHAPMLTAAPPYAIQSNTPPAYVEQVSNGAIYQTNMSTATLFSSSRKPKNIGDTLKIDIDEKLSISRKLNTDTSRSNSVASKGPGGSGSGIGIMDRMLNLNASASGSDSFKGSGTTDNNSNFSGKLAASVINVLPNGNLVVAGERSITLSGNLSTLRFAGVVNPEDIKAGNIVASGDVINARFEIGGQGDVQDAASRNWMQRVLTNYLAIW